jgi:RimJ/RimL family protein N-acetyltransferase
MSIDGIGFLAAGRVVEVYRRLYYFPIMQTRPAQPADLDHLIDLDATIEATEYLHLERGGEGLAASWRLEQRPLREKRIDANAMTDEQRFAIKQIVTGVEDGIALAVEYGGHLMALASARTDAENNTLQVIDIRVDYEYRRQGLGSALLYQLIHHAREAKMRAVTATTLTNNLPAARFLAKGGFDLAGVNTHLHSNHDLVKEAVSLFWYAAFD